MKGDSTEPQFSSKPRLKKMKISRVKILCCVFSILTYILDIGFDIIVAVRHYNKGNKVYFDLTVLFILLPAVIITAISVWWYIHDYYAGPLHASSRPWVIITFLTLSMAPALRNMEALYYAAKSTKSVQKVEKENFARKMIYANTDALFLRLIEAFLECAPQLILQIHSVAKAHYIEPNDLSNTEKLQLISIFTSLVSMSWAIVSYLRSLRESLDYKNELTFSISIIPFLWRFFEITARVVTLGLFASIFLKYFFLLSGIHFCAMFVWIYALGTDFCDNNKHAELVYNLILSFIFIFCFINPKDNNTRTRCMIYYLLVFGETSVLISIWYQQCVSEIRLPVLIMVFVCIALAIISMLLYYVLLHPTRGILFGKPILRNRSTMSVNRSLSITSRFTASREFLGTPEGTKTILEAVKNGKPTMTNGDEHRPKF